MPVYIYALADPRDGRVRYVGKTTDPTARKKYHHAPSSELENKHRGSWIAELRSQNLRAEFKVLEECTEENWRERERYWIARHGGPGILLNLRTGGEWRSPVGGMGHIVRESTREKLRQANIKQFSNPESRTRHSEGVRKWAKELEPEKRERALSGLALGRKVGPQAAKASWESRSPEDKKARLERMHAWKKNISPEEFSKIQRERCMKRYKK